MTAAIFAPVPGITVDQGLKEVGQMIIAADYQGGIKVYVNSEKLWFIIMRIISVIVIFTSYMYSISIALYLYYEERAVRNACASNY